MPTPATTPATTTTPTTATASTPAAPPEAQAGFAPTPNKAAPLLERNGNTASGVNLHASPSWTDWARARRLGSRCDDDGAVRLGISGYDGAGTDGVIEATCSPAAAQPSGAAEATQPMTAPMTAPKTAPMATAPALELSSTPPEAAPDAGQFGSLESFAEDKKELDEDEKPEIMPEIKPLAEAKMELDEEIPEIMPEIKPLAEVKMELDDEMLEIEPEIKPLAEAKMELEDGEMPEIEPEIEPEDAPEEPGAELEDKLEGEQMDEPKPAEEWNCKALPMAPSLAEAAATAMAATEPTAAAEAAVLAHVDVAKPAAFPVAAEALALSEAPLPLEPMHAEQVGEVVFLPTEAAEQGVAPTAEEVTLGEAASAADAAAEDHAEDIAAAAPTLTEPLLDAAAEHKPATDEAMAEATDEAAPTATPAVPAAVREAMAAVAEATAALPQATAPKSASVPHQESPVPAETEMSAAERPRPMLAAWSLIPVMLPVGFGTLAGANRSHGSDAATEEANSVSESNSEAGAAANAQANAQANVQTNARAGAASG